MSTPVTEAQQDSISPRIGAYLEESQYFLFIEGLALNQMETFGDAMFLLCFPAITFFIWNTLSL